MPEQLRRIDPPGCGCTDCLTGYSKPLDLATENNIDSMWLGILQDATSVDWRPVFDRINAATAQARRDAIRELVEVRRV